MFIDRRAGEVGAPARLTVTERSNRTHARPRARRAFSPGSWEMPKDTVGDRSKDWTQAVLTTAPLAMPCLLVQPAALVDECAGGRGAGVGEVSARPPAGRPHLQHSGRPLSPRPPEAAADSSSDDPSQLAAGRRDLCLATTSASEQPQELRAGWDADEIWRLSQSSHNVRVQEAISLADAEQAVFLDAFRGRVDKAMACGSANHVLQKLIASARPESFQFVVDEILSGAGAMEAACHKFGCRIVQRLVEHCLPHQVERMVEELLAEGERLACHRYGSYVAQRLIEFGGSEVTTRLSQQLLNCVPQLTSKAQGCAVLRLALSMCEESCRRQVARAVLGGSLQDLREAVCSRFAYPVVLNSFELVEGMERERALLAVLGACHQPLGNRFSRIVHRRILERAASGPPCPLRDALE